MNDKLCLNGLVVPCRIGVTEAERAAPQRIGIDLELAIDAARAAAHDDVREAIDYAAVVGVVSRHVQGQAHRLLETVAEEIAAVVLQEFPTPRVTVRVTKRAVPTIDSASVEVTRTRVTGDDDGD